MEPDSGGTDLPEGPFPRGAGRGRGHGTALESIDGTQSQGHLDFLQSKRNGRITVKCKPVKKELFRSSVKKKQLFGIFLQEPGCWNLIKK